MCSSNVICLDTVDPDHSHLDPMQKRRDSTVIFGRNAVFVITQGHYHSHVSQISTSQQEEIITEHLI